MSWRHVMITQPARLSVKHSQLVIHQDEEVTLPLQDIASILIESSAVTVTARLISECAARRISLVTCDDKKLPNGMLTGFQQHSRQLTVLQIQLGFSKPFKKRLWKRIIQQKLTNQAICLELLEKEGASKLRNIVNTVESGDSSNREGYAAKIYFPYVFGSSFTRRSGDPVNHLLNYGYSIMRSLVARSLVNYGFTTCLGIHHDNQLNSFNLADDFMEVLRPFVDFRVAQMDPEKWNVVTRAGLVNLVNYETKIGNEEYALTTAVDEMTKSFVACCRQQDLSYLKLPTLIKSKVHEAV